MGTGSIDRDTESPLIREMSSVESITVYHYTNERAWREMNHGGSGILIINGRGVDCATIRGLAPYRLFLRPWQGAPKGAQEMASFAFLEPAPTSWVESQEFPHLWAHLVNHVSRRSRWDEDRMVMLSITLYPTDPAHVVERAHMERALYGPTDDTNATTEAMHRYWESRVPLFEYQGGYQLPEVVLWDIIPLDRLSVVWAKPTDEVWQAARQTA